MKTDKIDARKLVELLRVDYLPQVRLPDPDTEQLRHLMSDRQSIVDRRTKLKNRVHAVLHRNLQRFDGTDIFGATGRKLLNAAANVTASANAATASPALTPHDAFRLKSSRADIDPLELRVNELDSMIPAFIVGKSKFPEYLDRLLSITGVSLVVGVGLLAAIGDVTRYPHPRKFASYFGLVPSTFQCGDSPAYHGHITKRGRAQARWLAIEAAEHLRESPGPLRAFYSRIAKRRGHNIAVVAVARKLAELCWHILTKKEDFIYALPRLTEEKRARVRFMARQFNAADQEEPVIKAKGGANSVSPLYGSGLSGRVVKTRIVAQVATQAETQYEKAVANRQRTNHGQASSDTERQSTNGFNPLNPNAVDWQKVLEKVAEQDLKGANQPKTRKPTSKPVASAAKSSI